MISTEIRFFSKTLGMRVAMNALLPDNHEGPLATLYLLHGLSDDHTIWTRLTRLESYTWSLPLAIVMPQGFRGFYTNHENGPAYADYIVNDVIETAQRVLPLSRKPKNRSIAGLSMGGYGALRLALGYPGLFIAAASHSGALLYGHQKSKHPKGGSHDYEYNLMFGKNPAGTQHDLLHLAAQRRADKQLPKLYLDCGTDDFLLDHNQQFTLSLSQQKIPHVYNEFPGSHNWDYWDLHIRDSLEFVCSAMGVHRPS
jgi:putative tributyrin esterase